jgi:DNA-binding PadR family transcriptional regulator
MGDFRGFGPPGFGRGPKARRGDVRAAILDVLSEQPMNGYQIIQQIAERSGGVWKPSPGSVYPTLQQLEDEGLVRAVEGEGRRLLELTDEGRAYVADNADELAATWRAFDQAGDEGVSELKPLIAQVMAACWQVAVAGSPQQQDKAGEILADTRRKLYGLLAEDDPR